MKFLTVLTSESKTDKNGKLYNKISVRTDDHVLQNGRKIRIEPKVQTIVKYPESYLKDGSPQFGHDLKAGEAVAGDIVTKAGFIGYPITNAAGDVERMATSSTHVILGDSDNAEAFALTTLKEFNSRGCFLASDPESEARYSDYWEMEAPDSLVAVEADSTEEEATV